MNSNPVTPPSQSGVAEIARPQAPQRPTVPLPPIYSKEETGRFLEALHPASVFEIRIINCEVTRGDLIVPSSYKKTITGYFDSIEDATVELQRVRGVSVYVSVNPVSRDLLARSYNRLSVAKVATTDADISVVRHLFIDIDPKRVTGVSATDDERQASLTRAQAILDGIPGLRECSHWGSSGNGAWIVVRLPNYPNDDRHREVYATAVHALHDRFSDDSVSIDTAAKNVGRIMCLPGTVKCKGDSIPDRPHRLATMDSPSGERQPFDLVAWVEANRSAKSVPAPATTLAIPSSTRGMVAGSIGSNMARCGSYIAKMDAAVQGQDGSGQLFNVACETNRFGLSQDMAFALIKNGYNDRCVPPWSDKEILHKIEDAYAKFPHEFGMRLDNQQPQVFVGDRSKQVSNKQVSAPPASRPFGMEADPRRLARLHLHQHHTLAGERTLVFYQGSFLDYHESAYRELSDKEINAQVTNTLEVEFSELYQLDLMAFAMAQARGDSGKQEGGKKEGKGGGKCPERRAVTKNAVGNVRLNLEGETLLRTRDCDNPPAWLGEPVMPWPPHEVLPMKNALVHLPSYLDDSADYMVPPTPKFFSTYAVDYDFDPIAAEPVNFLTLLGHLPLSDRSVVKNQIWRDGDKVDHESIATLQEWFGLQLLPNTSYEKIMAWIGPPRSGKGTLAKVLKALVGHENVAGPTLGGLATQFGLEPLIGKPVAIVDDARLSGRSDQSTITERFLTISGNGHLTVDRKHRTSWSGRLPTRFTIISNELPRLEDSSGALASRLIVLRFEKSYIGQEDLTLFETLRSELPGILLWAIAGWKRLNERKAFRQPQSGIDLVDDMRDLSSPIMAFIRDCCEVGPDNSVERSDIFEAWLDWCHAENRKATGNQQSFGRDLKAAVPGVGTGQGDKRDETGKAIKSPKGSRAQVRYYKGISVTNRPPTRPNSSSFATPCNTLQTIAHDQSRRDGF